MPKPAVGYPNAWVVTATAIFAVLPGAVWIVSLLGLLLVRARPGSDSGWHVILRNPKGVAAGTMTAVVYFIAAWLLEREEWPGAVLAAGLFAYSALAAAAQHQWRPSTQLLVSLVALGFAVSAFRLLRRYRGAVPAERSSPAASSIRQP